MKQFVEGELREEGEVHGEKFHTVPLRSPKMRYDLGSTPATLVGIQRLAA
jgi:hypothetical protein